MNSISSATKSSFTPLFLNLTVMGREEMLKLLKKHAYRMLLDQLLQVPSVLYVLVYMCILLLTWMTDGIICTDNAAGNRFTTFFDPCDLINNLIYVFIFLLPVGNNGDGY